MALTDEELSRAGWMECRGFLRGTRPPASFVSTAGAKGAAVLCRLREEKKKQPLHEDEENEPAGKSCVSPAGRPEGDVC